MGFRGFDNNQRSCNKHKLYEWSQEGYDQSLDSVAMLNDCLYCIINGFWDWCSSKCARIDIQLRTWKKSLKTSESILATRRKDDNFDYRKETIADKSSAYQAMLDACKEFYNAICNIKKKFGPEWEIKNEGNWINMNLFKSIFVEQCNHLGYDNKYIQIKLLPTIINSAKKLFGNNINTPTPEMFLTAILFSYSRAKITLDYLKMHKDFNYVQDTYTDDNGNKQIVKSVDDWSKLFNILNI